MGNDMMEVVLKFFTSGKMSKGINSTLIAFIPKSSHADIVEDYRPVFYYNTLYKMI